MSPEARVRSSSFDELARGLASGNLTRGKALRLMGAALVGSTLASIPGIARAKPKPGKCNHPKQCGTPECTCFSVVGEKDKTCIEDIVILELSCAACPPASAPEFTLCVDLSGRGTFACARPCPEQA